MKTHKLKYIIRRIYFVLFLLSIVYNYNKNML